MNFLGVPLRVGLFAAMLFLPQAQHKKAFPLLSLTQSYNLGSCVSCAKRQKPTVAKRAAFVNLWYRYFIEQLTSEL
jgi:hypothetical protein